MGLLVDLSAYEHFEQLTQGRVRYYEAGRAKPTLLLLHGMGLQTSADTFQWVFLPLAKKHHVIALDYLGFGKSDRVLTNGPTFDVIIDGIREFMDHKKLKDAVLVGHSAGGWFGPILAYESPARVRKLISFGGAGLNEVPSTGVSDYQRPSLEGIMNGITPSIYPSSQINEGNRREWAEAMYAIATRPGAYEGLKPLVEQMANADKRKSYLLHRRLPFIRVPSLWVFGEVERMEPYPTWTKEWSAIKGSPRRSSKPWVVPGGKYLMVKGATHNMQWEQPAKVVKIIEDFVSAK